MSLLNEKYDKIVCISLREREDKYKFMIERFKKFDIKAEFYRPVIPGYARPLLEPYINIHKDKENRFNPQFPNELGAMQSHYSIIKTALLQGAQSLFVFEDDCAFHKDWDNLLPKYLNTIPENTDGILLYSYMNQLEPQNVRLKPRWTKGFASWSFVAYGLNRRAMEGYIKLQDSAPMIADRGSWVMMTFQDYNFVVASPPLVLPAKNLASSIRGDAKNYENYRKSIFVMGVNENDYK